MIDKKKVREAKEQIKTMRVMNMDVSQYSNGDLKWSRALKDKEALDIILDLAQLYLDKKLVEPMGEEELTYFLIKWGREHTKKHGDDEYEALAQVLTGHI